MGHLSFMEGRACPTNIIDYKTHGAILSRLSRRERLDIDTYVRKNTADIS
jgi:hypothetical protein